MSLSNVLPTPVAVGLGIIFGIFILIGVVMAVRAKRRLNRLLATRRVTPLDVARGHVAPNTLVQLVGRATGRAIPAPWSQRNALAWQHYTVTITEGQDDEGRKTEHRTVAGHEESREPWFLTDHAAKISIQWPPAAKPTWESPPAFSRTEADPKDRWKSYAYEEQIIVPDQNLVLIGHIQGLAPHFTFVFDASEAAIATTGIEPLIRKQKLSMTIGIVIAASVFLCAVLALVFAFSREDSACPSVLDKSSRCCMPGTNATGDVFSIRPQSEIVVQVWHHDWAHRIAPQVIFPDGKQFQFERGATGYIPISPTGRDISFRVRDAEGQVPAPYCLMVR